MDQSTINQTKELVKSLRELTFQLSNSLIVLPANRKTVDEARIKTLGQQMETHITQINQLLR